MNEKHKRCPVLYNRGASVKVGIAYKLCAMYTLTKLKRTHMWMRNIAKKKGGGWMKHFNKNKRSSA